MTLISSKPFYNSTGVMEESLLGEKKCFYKKFWEQCVQFYPIYTFRAVYLSYGYRRNLFNICTNKNWQSVLRTVLLVSLGNTFIIFIKITIADIQHTIAFHTIQLYNIAIFKDSFKRWRTFPLADSILSVKGELKLLSI